MTLSKLDKEEAKSKLDESKGYIAKALELVNA
jgi:N-acetylmuramic acid 6-phosphate (MurNAc-6-P) etherase